MKFVICVEWATEKEGIKNTIKTWLDERLSQKVAIQLIDFKGWSTFRKDIAQKARMHLEGPRKDEIIAVIGLLDLYIPTQEGFYPPHIHTADERYRWGKAEIENNVNHPKFHMFFSVHEVEAWLLSQPDIFDPRIRKQIESKSHAPEKVNFNTPPAKFLNQVYKKHMKTEYKKTVHGSKLFRKLNPAIAYSKCPHLQSMLDDMKTLAQSAGL